MLKKSLSPVEGLTAWQFYLRLTWIVVQLLAAFYLCVKTDAFFYQGF
jgi:hypothetical protein